MSAAMLMLSTNRVVKKSPNPEPFEVIETHHVTISWKTKFENFFSTAGVQCEDGVIEFGQESDIVDDCNLIVGLVTRPFDDPMMIRQVIKQYGVDRIATSPLAMIALLRDSNDRKPLLDTNMANVFFWRKGHDIRVMVLMRRLHGWYLRAYRLSEAPNFLAGCRTFIPTPSKA